MTELSPMHSPVFTPGPWRWFGEQLVTDHLTIARKVEWWNGEREANARLIAAAPELYEALLDLLKSRGAYDGSKPAEWITSEEERGIAILAKARGDQ